MNGKEFFRTAAKRLRTLDPAVHTRFDFGGDVFRHRKDADPAFSYAMRGDIRIDRRKLLSGFLLLLSLLLFRRCRTRGKQS